MTSCVAGADQRAQVTAAGCGQSEDVGEVRSVPYVVVGSHLPLPSGVGSDLTCSKVLVQYFDCDLEENVQWLANLVCAAADGGRGILPGVIAATAAQIAGASTLDELRQLHQLRFLRH